MSRRHHSVRERSSRHRHSVEREIGLPPPQSEAAAIAVTLLVINSREEERVRDRQ